MTNEERAALIAQGWTPPKVVDPDIDMAHAYAKQLLDFRHPLNIGRAYDYFLGAIKQARGLERAEAKPGMVWVKHDGSGECPVNPDSYVWVKRWALSPVQTAILMAGAVGWSKITHYCEITPPEDVA